MKKLVLLIIKIIEFFEFKNSKLDQANPNHKILEAISIDSIFNIKTDTGFSPIALCNRTQPYDIWELETEDGLQLSGADHHIVFDQYLNQKMISELQIGNLIISIYGVSRVSKVIKTTNICTMLDFSLADFNHRYWTNGILSHNTVMSGLFIAWYLVFHTDKNVLAVANIASTTKEVLDKIKSVLENLPFFLKPGCVSNNVMSMKYDNGCRLIGRTTTKNTGIGFTIHVLYIDEFAHINASYLDFFYRAIYPTISASKNSKIIITSTPNGMNRFYEIYMDAMNHNNEYVPLRVDWWQVPGRDDEWKRSTIANLGSEEDFNQEYGLQFFSSDKLLLQSKDLKKIFALRTQYVIPEWAQTPTTLDLLHGLTVHPNFSKLTLDNIKNDKNYYVFSIDTADGLNRDYSVINIFKFIALPLKMLTPVKDFIKNETDIFSLVQVATFRTNTKDINQYCNSLEYLLYTVFNTDKVRLLVELNHKGEYVMDKIMKHESYWSGLLVFSKHTESAQHLKPGLKLTTTNKIKFCERFKYLTAVNKILPNEFKTVHELGAFGRTANGTYRSQSGNDDLAMTCVNSAAFFESPNFFELANDELDKQSPEYMAEIYLNFLNKVYLSKESNYDFEMINSMNGSGSARTGNASHRLDENYIDNHKLTLQNFYGNTD